MNPKRIASNKCRTDIELLGSFNRFQGTKLKNFESECHFIFQGNAIQLKGLTQFKINHLNPNT